MTNNTEKLSDEVIAEIRRMREHGYTYSQICDELGVSNGSVTRYAKDAKKRKDWTVKVDTEARKLRKEGKTNQQIADIMNFNLSMVKVKLALSPKEATGEGTKKPATRKKLHKMLEDGYSIADIARKLDITERSIEKYLERKKYNDKKKASPIRPEYKTYKGLRDFVKKRGIKPNYTLEIMTYAPNTLQGQLTS